MIQELYDSDVGDSRQEPKRLRCHLTKEGTRDSTDHVSHKTLESLAISSRCRTIWSHEEEDWLVGWVERHVRDDFSGRIPWKSCVLEIQANESILDLFHPSHLSATALHEACKRIAKRHCVSVKQLSHSLCSICEK